VSVAKRRIECPREPVGLSLGEAARFIGVSANTFQRAVDEHIMPPPRELFGRRIWDADEVLAAFRRLQHDSTRGARSQQDDEPNEWDEVL
jgi:hypothetical protein